MSITGYNGLILPTVFVATDYPAVSLFGSQLAGWGVKVGDFSAMGSGPARALALKPKKVFEKVARAKCDVWKHYSANLISLKLTIDFYLKTAKSIYN